MAKKIEGYIKLEIPAGGANPSPPVGPALGQRGLNIMEFCKAFNAATQSLEQGMPIPVVITAYSDATFSFVTKTPPASFLIRNAARLLNRNYINRKGLHLSKEVLWVSVVQRATELRAVKVGSQKKSAAWRGRVRF